MPKECLTVSRCRGLVLIAFGCLAIVGATLGFVYTKEAASVTFEEQWSFLGQDILEGVSANAEHIFASVASDAGLYTTVALETGSVAPFLNLQDFEAQATATLNTGVSLLLFAPLIFDDSTREQWETYTLENADSTVRGFIWQLDEDGSVITSPRNSAPYAPSWQMAPAPKDARAIVNLDYTTIPLLSSMMQWTLQQGEPQLSHPLELVSDVFGTPSASMFDEDESYSVLMYPVKNGVASSGSVVGHLLAALPWTSFLDNILQPGQDGVRVVVDSCGSNRTYELNGPNAVCLGQGDLHDSGFDGMVKSSPFASFGQPTAEDKAFFYCEHTMYVFPSVDLQAQYINAFPGAFAGTVIGVVAVAVLLFIAYDFFKSKKERTVEPMQKGDINAIVLDDVQQAQNGKHYSRKETDSVSVSSSSDSSVDQSVTKPLSKKMLKQDVEAAQPDPVHATPKPVKQEPMAATVENKTKECTSLTDFVSKSINKGEEAVTKSIAEFYPEATVLFADIAGFTAWSSIREPSAVFRLLEKIFGSFDKIADEMGVFKVETVGDCYVAVCGLPSPNRDHAFVMGKFARACLERVNEVIRELELTLGPDTADLSLRFGLHSGQVTAGVLRGNRARFQLFGDTVNTASRIETTGMRNRIHLSEQTATILKTTVFKRFVIKREDAVEAKGKGLMQTYWLQTVAETVEAAQATEDQTLDFAGSLKKSSFGQRARAAKEAQASKDLRNQRLVAWNAEIMVNLLKTVVNQRTAEGKRSTSQSALKTMAQNIGNGSTVVEEVAEVITMPEFNAAAVKVEASNNDLPPGVAQQVYNYVGVVAGMYRENPFHNFEHASHVTMSVSKLLTRIVAPKLSDTVNDGDEEAFKAAMHDHTYGITSDPLTQFAVVLSALVHDIDHRGVPNFLLAAEEPGMASMYKNKSVAEQNSVDLAWNALMSDGYEELRRCIFGDIAELRRFRQLLVNSVIATDIFDKELGDARKARWNKAFSEEFAGSKAPEDVNRKATIVIEHLIQASDVAHTMQHWHVYTKWNERLFQEMYKAHKDGRWEIDPTANWFQGEIGFLENYVIPLAKKLKECGVFGVSSDEYLNYATENLREWKSKGEEIVRKFREKHCNDAPTSADTVTAKSA